MHKINRVKFNLLDGKKFKFVDEVREVVADVDKFFDYGKAQARLAETSEALGKKFTTL